MPTDSIVLPAFSGDISHLESEDDIPELGV